MDIFVAYSSRDEQQVRTIVEWLRRHGLNVWAAYELPAGVDWDTEIDRVLAEIPCVLAVWSTHAVKSAEVKGEARAAMARDALVTVTLDGALPPRSFTHLHAVDLTGLSVDEESPRTAQALGGIRAKLATVDRPAADLVDAPDVAAPSPPTGTARGRPPLWSYIGGGLIAVAALFLVVADDSEAQASCRDDGVYRLAGQTFDKDTTIDHATVCIAENAEIRVRNGAHLSINATDLILQGAARVDGRGTAGSRGAIGSNGPSHHHKPPAVLGIAICANAPPRSDYDAKPGGRGGNGGPGAKITISYVNLHGDPALLKYAVSGGKGGPGGRGGKAGRAVCKASKPYDVRGRSGRQGASGSPGKDGSFELVHKESSA